MARITVEGCLENVKNRFELVLVATQRARQLLSGLDAKVPWDNDKATVVSLREIEEGHIVDLDQLDEIEHAHQQATHAAEAGIADDFMAGGDGGVGTIASTDDTKTAVEPVTSSLEAATLLSGTSSTAQEEEPARYVLRSEPSIFEQVASRSGPVESPAQNDVSSSSQADLESDPSSNDSPDGNTDTES